MTTTEAAPTRVRVALGERGYDIIVGAGLLADAGSYLEPVLDRRRTIIVTDEHVAAHHLAPVQASLAARRIDVDAIVLPPGEATKSFARLEMLIDALLTRHVERADTIVALGGGVVGDLAGFAAAVLRRGVAYVQAPTTLLAQVDSSVGGKTAINTPHGKNLVGAFYQPRLVLADVAALSTLPRREMLAGYAEVAKYGLLGDAEFFTWLEQNGRRVIEAEEAALIEAVVRSCRAKARVVAADERESGERALLNLGHTFGHALEAEVGYDQRLLHGEAVAIGMVMAFRLSVALGLCPPRDAERAAAHLASVGLPTSPAEAGFNGFEAGAILAHMRQDKKVRDGQLTLVLARGIGEAFVTREIAEADVEAIVRRELAA